jgi:toxin ParE1/3/4
MEVIWAASALADLKRVYLHILESNPSAAASALETIQDSCLSLGSLPDRGRISRIRARRELVFQSLPYIAVYLISKQRVEILRIFHSAQDWP